MEQTNITGYCYMDEDFRPYNLGVGIWWAFICVMIPVASFLLRMPRFLIIELIPLLLLILHFIAKRFGYDPAARYELTQGCVQTTSKSKKMCRRISWAETSVIQITRVEGTRVTPAMDYYVFVRGRENALARSQALENYVRLCKNPNRIVICKSEKTRPFVTEIAERYGIPVEYSYQA
jgi:hypothetical protein